MESFFVDSGFLNIQTLSDPHLVRPLKIDREALVVVVVYLEFLNVKSFLQNFFKSEALNDK